MALFVMRAFDRILVLVLPSSHFSIKWWAILVKLRIRVVVFRIVVLLNFHFPPILLLYTEMWTYSFVFWALVVFIVVLNDIVVKEVFVFCPIYLLVIDLIDDINQLSLFLLVFKISRELFRIHSLNWSTVFKRQIVWRKHCFWAFLYFLWTVGRWKFMLSKLNRLG